MDYILTLKDFYLNIKNLNLRPVYSHERTTTTVSLRDFTIIKCLGSGGFSYVFLVKSNFDNKFYAMKLM